MFSCVVLKVFVLVLFSYLTSYKTLLGYLMLIFDTNNLPSVVKYKIILITIKNLSTIISFLMILSFQTLLSCPFGIGRAVEYTDCFSGEGSYPSQTFARFTTVNNGEVPVMLELWRMQSSSSLPSPLGPLWS